jgi:signal transduction histidine kinase
MTQKQRKLKNYLIRPEKQLKVAAAASLLFLLVVGAFVMFNFYIALQYIQMLGSIYGIQGDMMSRVATDLTRGAIYVAVALFMVSVFLFVYAIKISHTFFGPLVPIERLVTDLRNGQYGTQAHLRKGDQLQSLADQLNELSKTLAEKHKKN